MKITAKQIENFFCEKDDLIRKATFTGAINILKEIKNGATDRMKFNIPPGHMDKKIAAYHNAGRQYELKGLISEIDEFLKEIEDHLKEDK